MWGGEMILGMLEDGGAGTVSRIEGGRGLRGRLMRLGIMPGVRVRKVHGGIAGPVVVEVMGSSVMLGRGMADSVELG
jgi:Fe2+ transport system protein FeoA